jgi:hypothetical protein
MKNRFRYWLVGTTAIARVPTHRVVDRTTYNPSGAWAFR